MARTGILGKTAAAALALSVLAVPGRAEALQRLAQDGYVADRLVAARVADRIRTTCPTISARMFRVLAEVNRLESYARGQGYDTGTVRAFLRDKTARAGIYERAETYLAENGVVAGDEDSYCRLGRAEIGAGSLIGSLIRAR